MRWAIADNKSGVRAHAEEEFEWRFSHAVHPEFVEGIFQAKAADEIVSTDLTRPGTRT